MKRMIKRLLCLLLCLACVIGIFALCAPTQYKIYHQEIYCTSGTRFLWYTPFASRSFAFGCTEDESYKEEQSTQDVSLYSQFQWNGETISGRYQYTRIPYHKGMYDLKEDIQYDYYSTPDSVGYEFAVDRKSSTLRSCHSFGTDPMRDFDVGADARKELLEQVVSRLEARIPDHMKSAFVSQIDPDGYRLSYRGDPDLNVWLLSLQVTLHPDGSLESFSGDNLECIAYLSSTNRELLQRQYRQLSDEEAIKAAVEEQLHWLYQTPREDSHFVHVTSYAYPELYAAKDEEKYLLFETAQWEFDSSAKEPIQIDSRLSLSPTGKLFVRATARVYTTLTSTQGEIINDYRSPTFYITLF